MSLFCEDQSISFVFLIRVKIRYFFFKVRNFQTEDNFAIILYVNDLILACILNLKNKMSHWKEGDLPYW